jgi:predicted transcriptional regulator
MSKTKSKSESKRLKKLVQPQEVIVWYILPAIRRTLTNTLIDEYKMPQTKIAKRFGLTEPAISQYKDKAGKKNTRGKQVEFSKVILDVISDSARRIAEDDEVYAPREVQQILKFIEKGGHLCEFHKQFGLVHANCKVCKSI